LIAAIEEEAWGADPLLDQRGSRCRRNRLPALLEKAPRGPPHRPASEAHPGSQLALFATYDYHAFITNRTGDMIELEADHRRHAVVEDVIRDLKYGVGLNHLPSGRFPANAAWMLLNVLAHNLARWVPRIGLGAEAPPMNTKTVRTRLICLPGRMTTSGRKTTLHSRGTGRGSSLPQDARQPARHPPAEHLPAQLNPGSRRRPALLPGARRRQQPQKPCLSARPL